MNSRAEPPAAAPPPKQVPRAAAAPVSLAKAKARAALAQLREATNACRECPLGEPATQSVFGEGPPRAALMGVGEQPGDREDLAGRPFVSARRAATASAGRRSC